MLRIVAVTMTMLVHTPSLSRSVSLIRPFSGGLWLGVDLFMLISGWLLGGQLLREASSGELLPLRFYVKRWLRTLPLYYFMLAVLYAGLGTEFNGPLPVAVVMGHLLFLQGYVTPNQYGVSWSLCVEEHFYLLLPVLVSLLGRRSRLSTVLAFVCSAELISIALRALAFRSGEVGEVPFLSILRCHGLFVGLLLAWIAHERPSVWARMATSARAAVLLGPPAVLGLMATAGSEHSIWLYVCLPTFGTWALALVFLGSVHERSWASRIDFPGLKYLGGLTYAMYLVHSVIPREWLGSQGANSPASALWRATLVVGLSLFLHHGVERPGLRLRERVLARWNAPAAATAS